MKVFSPITHKMIQEEREFLPTWWGKVDEGFLFDNTQDDLDLVAVSFLFRLVVWNIHFERKKKKMSKHNFKKYI